MAVFKKTIKYSKSSKNLEDKIKNLDEDLKKTGVLRQEGSIAHNDLYKNQIEINEESNSQKGDELYDWRKSFIPEDNPSIFNDEVLESDITEEYVEEIREKHRKLSLVENSIEAIKVKEAQNIFQELYQDQVEQVVEKYVSHHSKDIISLREDLFLELKKKPTVDISSLEEKINQLTLKYKKLSEGLLNDPSQNSDPLTQSPVTIEQLKNHYQLLVGRLQEQLATVGGGGEVRLRYLDDVVGVATNPSAYDGKFLKYNHSLGKFEFDIASSEESYWVSTAAGIHTLSNVGIGLTNPSSALEVSGNTSLETLNVSGVSTFNDYVEVIGISSFNDNSTFTSKLSANELSLDKVTSLANLSVGEYSNTINFGNDFVIFHLEDEIFGTSNRILVNENNLIIGSLGESGGGEYFSNLITVSVGNDVGFPNTSNVSLGYGDNVTKLQTIGAGVTVTGTNFTNQLSVSGVSTLRGNTFVGSGITMYASTGIVSATAFYGDGSGLTGIVGSNSGIFVGEITLGGSPTWRGTSGVTVSQQSSGNYRVSFASTYTNANDYYVLAQGMDQGFASYVGIARSTTHVDLSINKQSDNTAVNTGSLAVQIKNHI